MQLQIALAGLSLLLFFIFFFKNKCKREAYLLFIVYFFPFMGLGVTPEAFGGLTVFDAICYFGFVFFINDFIFINRKKIFYFLLFFLLFVILAAGSIHSKFIQHSLLSILSILPIFIFAKLLMKELAVNPLIKKRIIKVFKFFFYIAVFFMAMQIMTGLRFTFYKDLNPNVDTAEGIRYPGFFADAQVNSLFLAMLSFLFLINFKNIRKPAALNFILFSAVIITLFYSGGRSAFLGLGVSLIFLLFFFAPRVKYFIGAAFLAVLLIIPFLKNSFILFQRLGSIDESYQFRSYIWKEALQIFNDNKMLGIGIGNYKNYVERYSPDQYYVLEDGGILILDQPENGYLKVLTEAGLFGFIIAFLFVLIPIFKGVYYHLFVKKNHLNLLFISSVICWFVSFNSLYTLSDRRIVILLTALLCFIIQSTDRKIINDENYQL